MAIYKKFVPLTINGKEIKARAGEKVLFAALDNGIYIPNLCAIREKPEQEVSCRLCWVEIEGEKGPVPACAVEVSEGMAVNTKGEKALALARAGFDLLMASHTLDCAHCTAVKSCELLKIAGVLGCILKPRDLRWILRGLPVDDSHPFFTITPDKCVLCARCVWECHKRKDRAVLGFAYRGFDRVITTFGEEESVKDRCLDCGRCIKVCPTGALAPKNSNLKT